MRHLKARQRESDGRWDFTEEHKSVIRPVGYCKVYTDPDKWNIEAPEAEKERVRSNKDKYHSGGHETEEEARECYKQYLIDNRISVRFEPETLVRCQVCDEWTHNRIAVDGYNRFVLCDEHNNRDVLQDMVKTPHEYWIS